MDDGVLRKEPTHAAAVAVAWLITHARAARVINRYCYGPGRYDYHVGHADDDFTDASIVREDRLRAYGITTPPEQIELLYPYAEQPHEMRQGS
jgi:hypothetical protein